MAESLDARGLSCPQPAILIHGALKKAGSGELLVQVDTMTQVQNCSRVAERLGWRVGFEERGGLYELKLTK